MAAPPVKVPHAELGGVRRPTAAADLPASELAIYQRVVVRVPNGQTRLEEQFDVTGDHLFVEELVGRKLAYVRLGLMTNPYLPLVERATYRRRFDRLTVRIEDDALTTDANLGEFRASLLVSTGPLVQMPETDEGLEAGFMARRDTATTTVGSVFAAAGGAIRLPVFGKRGGVFTLKNTDATATLYFRYGDPSVTAAVDATFFPLEAGESYTAPLRSLVNQSAESILVGTTVGTCDFAFLASPGALDAFDLGNVQPVVT